VILEKFCGHPDAADNSLDIIVIGVEFVFHILKKPFKQKLPEGPHPVSLTLFMSQHSLLPAEQ
jgi:hypothetical protein